MERYAPSAKDLASRDVVSRSEAMEIREGRGVGEHKDHIFLHLDHIDPKILHERLPGITETAKTFAGVDLTRQPIPVAPTVHYTMGGIPTNYHGEVVTLKDGNPDAVVPGLFAVGEAACVSVHGANRLGSNSLIDLVVFGRAAGLRLAEVVKKGALQEQLPKDAADLALARLDKFRHAEGGSPTAEIRLDMQRTMQADCAVFRTDRTLAEGVAKIDAGLSSDGRRSRHRPQPDLEQRPGRNARARQPPRPGGRHHALRRQPQGKPRRAHAGRLSRARRQELDEAHHRLVRRLGRHAAAASRSTTARCTNSRSPTTSSTSSRRSGFTKLGSSVDSYFLIKTLHVLGATVLFGTGLGIAFFFWSARHDDDQRAPVAARTTVLADFLFTLPAVILQPVTESVADFEIGTSIRESIGLLRVTRSTFLRVSCSIPVVALQIRMKRMLEAKIAGAEFDSRAYERLRKAFVLGWPAFTGLVVVFWLMVAKPNW